MTTDHWCSALCTYTDSGVSAEKPDDYTHFPRKTEFLQVVRDYKGAVCNDESLVQEYRNLSPLIRQLLE